MLRQLPDWAQVELLPQLLRMMDVKTMTGSEGQRKLTLGNATILAYCLRWAGFRVSAPSMHQSGGLPQHTYLAGHRLTAPEVPNIRAL